MEGRKGRSLAPLKAPALPLTLVHIKEELSGVELVGVNELEKPLWLMVWHLLSHYLLSTYYVPGSVPSSSEQELSFMLSTVIGSESCCFPFPGEAQSNEVHGPRSPRVRLQTQVHLRCSGRAELPTNFLFFLFLFLFSCWLHWVFVAAFGLPLVEIGRASCRERV